jgi:S1-C subfamily serine protease
MVIGDILVSLAGQSIARFEDVQSHLQPENIGKALTAKIVRGGAAQEVSVAVSERPRGDN